MKCLAFFSRSLIRTLSMATPFGRTADGFETQFGTNHLGHFVFVNRIATLIRDGGRFVSLASSGHRFADVDLDDPGFDATPYEPFLAYGRSKTANVLFAVEATRRWADDGITANSLMPGGIMTNLQRHVPEAQIERMKQSATMRMKTVEQGAATSVLCAARPELEGVGGRYFEDCNEARVVTRREPSGVAAFAIDPDNARRLWDVSLELL